MDWIISIKEWLIKKQIKLKDLAELSIRIGNGFMMVSLWMTSCMDTTDGFGLMANLFLELLKMAKKMDYLFLISQMDSLIPMSNIKMVYFKKTCDSFFRAYLFINFHHI